VPNLGVVTTGDVVFTVADVPGLIEGASEGRGLGLEFLRHVERCSVLVHVLDCATHEIDRDPLHDLDVIEDELAAYGGLEGRPRLVALNKVDLPDGRAMADLMRPLLEERGLPVFEISASAHMGLRPLTFAMAAEVVRHRESTIVVEPVRVVVTPRAVDDAGFSVVREGDSFRVIGDRPERWVRQTDFSNDEAVGYLADRLARLGIEERLLKLGATPGCEVLIGPADNAVVFDWEPTLLAGGGSTGPRGTDVRLEGR
jgi:GTP-binding protein